MKKFPVVTGEDFFGGGGFRQNPLHGYFSETVPVSVRRLIPFLEHDDANRGALMG